MESHPPRQEQASDSRPGRYVKRSRVRLTAILIAIPVALILLLADQASKSYIVSNYVPNDFIAGTRYVSLVFVTNIGGICGYAQGAGTLLTAMGIVTSVLLIAFLFTAVPANAVYGIAFGMLLAGAVGNLIDRLRFGYVVDFITLDLLRWPSFNIADASIVGGVALTVLLTGWDMLQEQLDRTTGDTVTQGPEDGPRVLGMTWGWSTVILLVVAGASFAVAYWFCVYRPFD